MKMIDKEKTSRFECKLFGNDHAEKNYRTYNPTCNNGGTQAHEEEVWVSCKK